MRIVAVAVLLLSVGLFSCPAMAEYAIFDLNAVSGTFYGCANSINDYCDIALHCSPSETDQSVQVPCIWTETNGLQQLAGGYGIALCVSNHRIAGGFIKGRSGRIATMWRVSTGTVYEYPLPGLTGPHSQVNSIGISGHICGQATIKNGALIEYVPCIWECENRNVVYHADLRLTPNDSGGYDVGYDTSTTFDPFFTCIRINGSGTSANLILPPVNIDASDARVYTRVLGGSLTSTGASGFIVTNNVVANDSSASYTDANFVNQLCGTARVDGVFRAFSQTGSTRTLLPLYPGDTDGYACAMNNPKIDSDSISINMCGALLEARNMSADEVESRNTSQVVGYSTSASGVCHAFVWSEENGAEVLPDLGGGSACAKDINEYGEICGWAKDDTGRVRAVLWRHIPGSTPTPFLRSAGPMPLPGLQPGPVNLSGWQVTTKNVSISTGRASYIQAVGYPFGIKVRGSYGLRKKDLVDFSGILSVSHGEKQLSPRKILFQGYSDDLPPPFGGSHRSLAGSCPNALVTGLRVRVWGRVIEISPCFPGYLIRLDDGSHVVESDAYTYYPLDSDGHPILSQPIYVPEVYGVRAYTDEANVELGDFICVEGACSVLTAKTFLPQIVDAQIVYTEKLLN